ncbi:hypothetical protein V6N13_122281 [Hibiscus sabdariffa]|uniref:Uncharacterized protein n=2 Tax=Hibiscus sabdariffa TaxID=183260 RepID=A0ABR1ZTZ8_9ROSI
MSNPLPPPPPPPPPPPSLPSTSHHHHHQPPYITTQTTAGNREYRKGNWTLQETLTLITAKRIDEERRARPSTSSPSKPGELRWKWIENYCWDHGCFRSQNQCNDKWDNLLRDYKKVRQYHQSPPSQQPQSPHHHHHPPSYWSMDRHQRKLHNLPTNMSPEIFEALNHVLQRKHSTHQQASASQSPEQLAVRQQAPEIEAPATVSERSDSSETESSENRGSETKRKKVRKIGSSIMRSASVLARALRSCEESKEKRHQQVMELEHRRLRIEETQNEVNRKGMTELVAAMTNLSGAIQSLIANHYDQT